MILGVTGQSVLGSQTFRSSKLFLLRSLASHRGLLLLLICLALGLVSGCKSTKQGTARGEELYDVCESCHGVDGAGMPTVGAPAIAGLSNWYVAAQLKKFKDGSRGAHPEDLRGMQMRPMARSLSTDEEIEAVSAYVASLPVKRGPSMIQGNATNGQTLYGTCAACHGADGAGNQSLSAPPLKGADDWYLLAQLKKFKVGHRGTNPKDTTGAQMRPMALGLADDQAMRDVIAYINTLK